MKWMCYCQTRLSRLTEDQIDYEFVNFASVGGIRISMLPAEGTSRASSPRYHDNHEPRTLVDRTRVGDCVRGVGSVVFRIETLPISVDASTTPVGVAGLGMGVGWRYVLRDDDLRGRQDDSG